MDDDIQTWWEIPSIVYFCEIFSSFCEDLSSININEFEEAVEGNSYLLTDMAMRFVKACGFYDPDTKEWWTFMKKILQTKCIEYNFDYPLDSVQYFDDLTRKKKVESLYIMCHLVLDMEDTQYRISLLPKLWHTFNVKPLGYDLNHSVYWYFGTTRLYREDFENKINLSKNVSISQDFTQLNVSNNSNLSQSFQTEPYLSGIIGSGKWNVICTDDNNSWYSFADTTEYSKHPSIKSLHNSVCNIIKNLPQVKRKKAQYKYLELPQEMLRAQRVRVRSLRSTNFYEANYNDDYSILNSSIDSQSNNSSLNQDNETKPGDLFFHLDKSKSNENLCVQNQNILHSTILLKDDNILVQNDSTKRLKFTSNNIINTSTSNIKDANDLLKSHQDCLKFETRVNGKRFDQENNKNLENFKPLKRSTRLIK